MNNLASYCGLVDAKIRAYDKDLPVLLSMLLAQVFSKNIQSGKLNIHILYIWVYSIDQ